MRFMTVPQVARFSEWLEAELLQYGLSPRDAHAVQLAAEKQLIAIVPITIEEENASALEQCRNFVRAVNEYNGEKKPSKGATVL